MDTPTHISTISGRVARTWLMLLSVSHTAYATELPSKPTPPPGSLGAYAEKIILRRSKLCDQNGRLVLTNDNVARLGRGAAITLGAVSPAETKGNRAPKAASTTERSRWRATHQRQQEVITGLERRRARLEVDIDSLENQRLTIKTMARLQAAEARLQLLDREIAVERAELARIVREARRHGAEPGWFR